MKIFISWSGDRSREVAELLSEWISCVLQSTQPWVSSHDIERGAVWYSEIQSTLAEVTVGIICLTQANKENPWIMFEAGALAAKNLSTGRVCTFLIDLENSDVSNPLAQFNHTKPDESGVKKLVASINLVLPEERRLKDKILDLAFETYWPLFKSKFEAILALPVKEARSEPRAQEDILSEILETTRALSRRVANMESSAIRGFSTSDALRLLGPSTENVRDDIEKVASGKDGGEAKLNDLMRKINQDLIFEANTNRILRRRKPTSAESE
jgi:hypothetical protein